jgi:hypothetical protein
MQKNVMYVNESGNQKKTKIHVYNDYDYSPIPCFTNIDRKIIFLFHSYTTTLQLGDNTFTMILSNYKLY